MLIREGVPQTLSPVHPRQARVNSNPWLPYRSASTPNTLLGSVSLVEHVFFAGVDSGMRLVEATVPPPPRDLSLDRMVLVLAR